MLKLLFFTYDLGKILEKSIGAFYHSQIPFRCLTNPHNSFRILLLLHLPPKIIIMPLNKFF